MSSPSPGHAGPAPWPARLAVVVFATYTVIEQFFTLLMSEHHWESDFAQHVWWTARFADPTLFPNDYIADFFSLPLFAPVGYQAWMRTAVPTLGAQGAAEVLVLPLAAVLVWLGWRAGRASSGGSWVGAVIGGLVAAWMTGSLDGGLPRDFALPILCLGVVGLLERRPWVIGLAGVLASLFYPPVVVNLGLTAAVTLGIAAFRERRLPAGWPALVAFGVIAVSIVGWVYLVPVPDDVGPKVTGAAARTMPEFGPQGRATFFTDDTIETYFGRQRGGYGVDPALSMGFAVLVLISARTFPLLLPTAAWALIGTALLAHALAHATLFLLHLPQRYVLYALPVFALLFVASLGSRSIEKISGRLPAFVSPRSFGIAAALILLIDGGLSLRNAGREFLQPVYVDRLLTFEYLATLPTDALIATHPKDANAIPLRARRSVLVSKETALPYYRGYYDRVAERYEAALHAFYATDWASVDRLYDRYGVDVIVVHDFRYQKRERSVVSPFDTLVPERLESRKKFVLQRPLADRVLFRFGTFSVVRLGPPRPGYEPLAGSNVLIESIPAAAGTR